MPVPTPRLKGKMFKHPKRVHAKRNATKSAKSAHMFDKTFEEVASMRKAKDFTRIVKGGCPVMPPISVFTEYPRRLNDVFAVGDIVNMNKEGRIGFDSDGILWEHNGIITHIGSEKIVVTTIVDGYGPRSQVYHRVFSHLVYPCLVMG